MISKTYYIPEAANPDFGCIIPAAYNAEGSVGIVGCGIAPSPLMSLKIVETETSGLRNGEQVERNGYRETVRITVC
jgi:hypothetical protein